MFSDLSAYADDLERVFNGQDLTNWMQELLDEIANTRPFGNSRYNHGLTLRLNNGAQFEITIVQSVRADYTPCEECGELTDDLICQQCADKTEATTATTNGNQA